MRQLRNAADGTIQEYDDAIAGQPEEVAPGAWQARWYQLARVW